MAGGTKAGATVTGLGATTPLGGDVAATWAGMLAGRSGVAVLDRGLGRGPARPDRRPVLVDPAEVLGRVQARRLDRCQQAALVAAREAWADAGAPEVEPERLAVVIGTGVGGMLTTLDQDDLLEASGPRRVSPYTVPMLMPNGAAGVDQHRVRAPGAARTPR